MVGLGLNDDVGVDDDSPRALIKGIGLYDVAVDDNLGFIAVVDNDGEEGENVETGGGGDDDDDDSCCSSNIKEEFNSIILFVYNDYVYKYNFYLAARLILTLQTILLYPVYSHEDLQMKQQNQHIL